MTHNGVSVPLILGGGYMLSHAVDYQHAGAPEGCWYITGCVSCAAELDNCESVPRATHDRNN